MQLISSNHHSVSTAKGDELDAVETRSSHSPIQALTDKLIALIIALSQGLLTLTLVGAGKVAHLLVLQGDGGGLPFHIFPL